jgi:hypothetical protein
VGLFFAFAYFHSRSIDRAHFVNSVGALLTAHQQLRDTGSITNQRRVSVWTNQITVGGSVFQGQLIADSPALVDYGSLVMATDQTLIWIDKRTGPAVVRGANGGLTIPRRLHDF